MPTTIGFAIARLTNICSTSEIPFSFGAKLNRRNAIAAPSQIPEPLCAMLIDIPKFIGGAKTLFIAKSDIGFDTVVRDDNETAIEYISVCQYDPEEGFYFFDCDKDFYTHTDFNYDDEEAFEDAKRIYQIDEIVWAQIN